MDGRFPTTTLFRLSLLHHPKRSSERERERERDKKKEREREESTRRTVKRRKAKRLERTDL